MGWMGGLGRGMMQYGQAYGERLQEQKKLEWQENQNRLQWERDQHLQELRMKHEGALQEARLKQEADQFATSSGLEERRMKLQEDQFGAEYMGYIDGVGLITRKKAAELSEEERAKMVDMETYKVQRQMSISLSIQEQTAKFNQEQLGKQEEKIDGIEGLSDEEKQVAKVALYSPLAAEALAKKTAGVKISPEQARLAHKDGLADYDALPKDQKKEFLAGLKEAGLLEDPKATTESMEVRRKYADGYVADSFGLLGGRQERGAVPETSGPGASIIALSPEGLRKATASAEDARNAMRTQRFSQYPKDQQDAIRRVAQGVGVQRPNPSPQEGVPASYVERMQAAAGGSAPVPTRSGPRTRLGEDIERARQSRENRRNTAGMLSNF